MIILSVLMPTTPDRNDMFTSLLSEVNRQVDYMNAFHPTLGQIEIIVDDSKRFLEGGLSIGKKRESLLKKATGEYLCYLDSDDLIAPNYLEVLVRACQYKSDVITFRNFTKTDNFWTIVDMSLLNKNEEANPEIITRRTPWIICPIRSTYAKMFDFKDISYGEDADWLEKVLPLCKSEFHTDQILHSYQHSSKTSEADRITKQQWNDTAKT